MTLVNNARPAASVVAGDRVALVGHASLPVRKAITDAEVCEFCEVMP